MRLNLKIILSVLFIFFIWFILHTFFITFSGLNDDIHPADVVVILGNEVNPDGQPSARLKARLDKALEIFNNKQTKNLIVSGALGKEGINEALVMAKYLQANYVPSENIIVDLNGQTTEATAQNTSKIMSQYHWHSVLIISQYFHLARIKLAFQKNGITEIYSAHANYFELRDFYSISREFFAYYAYLFK